MHRRSVTTVTPMKRGLKELSERIEAGKCPVTTVTPMKRGLKEDRRVCSLSTSESYNRYPDEKGTESHGRWSITDTNRPAITRTVTTVTPMKRGLKDLKEYVTAWRLCRYNRYPDEKGTEREPVTISLVS